ncbi:MAG: hypothetical protein JXL97_10565 [Bacteroidales bacterium]|nr:hypothetical protein [Bacteroidales bacterium]
MQEFIIYQSKVAISLTMLFLVWRIFLRNDTFHILNRAFLIVSVVISFAIPLIKTQLNIAVDNQIAHFVLTPISVGSEILSNETEKSFRLINFLSVVYISIVSVLILLFLLKIFKVVRLIFNSEKKKIDNYKVISTNKNISPFAFLNYIFLALV